MTAKPSRQPTEDRQAEIVLTLLRLAAGRSALDITTSDIAQAMNLSQGALFRHFPTKEAMRLAVVAWIETKLLQLLDAARASASSPVDALRAMFLAHVDFFIAHPGVPRFIFGELQQADRTPLKERVRELMARYRERLAAVLDAASAAGLIRPGTDHAAAAALFLGAIQGLVIQSMVSGSMDGMRAQAEAVFGLYVQGLEAQS